MNMTCEQFLGLVSDYLDGELEAALGTAMQAHRAICKDCRVVLDTTGQMLRIVGDERTFTMPEGASQRLRQALAQGLDEPLVPAALRPAPTLAPPPVRHRAWFWGARQTALAVALVLILIAGGVIRWRAGAVTTSGWLMDRHCFAAFQTHAGDHPRDCLIKCAAQGYGLVDGQGHFRPFDANGNRTALAAVKASAQPDHLWVTVRAKRSSNATLQVEALALSDPADATR